MFELNLIRAINDYRNLPNSENKEFLLNLIRSNKEEVDKFLNNSSIDADLKKVVLDLVSEINLRSKKLEVNNNYEEISKKVSEMFLQWKENFISNNNQPNDKCVEIVREIVDFFYNYNIKKLLDILNIKEDKFFDKFKTMIKNSLRVKIANELTFFLDSEEYKKLNFIEKWKVKHLIKKITLDISKYKFEIDKIERFKDREW